VTELGKRSRRVTKQVLLQFTLGTDNFEQNFLVCSQLVGPVGLVQTSLTSYEIALDLKNNASIMKWGRSKTDFRKEILKSLIQELLRTVSCGTLTTYML
jgi:hypothetical protein